MKKSNAARIAGVSNSYVSKVIKGKINGEKNELILELLNLDKKHLPSLFADDRFWEVCEIAIAKSRKTEVTKFAVMLQRASESIRRKIKETLEIPKDNINTQEEAGEVSEM